ncbi:MAG: hypothetical protein HYZ81_08900 [Nitrospinae bacterium]|nr:hypothetical protein [Nitrospinota bacterium]
MRPIWTFNAVVFASLVVLSIPVTSWAHGFVGKRFLPTTLKIEDPFVSDELSLRIGHIKEPREGEKPPTLSTELSGEYSKRLTPRLGISLGGEFRHLSPDVGTTKNGFGNLELGGKYQFLTSARHEALLSIGLDVEIGGTGSRSVGAESFSTISPVFLFGKGFGDLPAAVKYLKPLAITGIVGPRFPTRSKNVTTRVREEINEETAEVEREVEREIERNPVTLRWGVTVQYNLQYLQSFVKDLGLGTPFNRMIALVEFPLDTCLNRGCGGRAKGTVNPGLIWFGKYVQLGIEATIPLNERTGKNVGVLGLVHFFIDDLFPQSLGRPFFR